MGLLATGAPCDGSQYLCGLSPEPQHPQYHLLDGLDKLAAEPRDACVDVIKAYRQEHGMVSLVVCSRVGEYEAFTTKLWLQGALVIQQLTQRQSIPISVGSIVPSRPRALPRW